MKVRKAVITAAGWGTRFLPVTKAQPKEMLPLVDRPLIQYSVEEAINSGIEQIILVTALGKQAIENYFDRSFELEYILEHKKDYKRLQQMRELTDLVDICYVRQKEQLGLGHAVYTARSMVGDEPFALLLPDDIIDSPVPVLKQMMDLYQEYQSSVLAVERIKHRDASKYGVIEPREISPSVYQVMSLVEKPEPARAPSDLGIVGRYILTPQIFAAIESTPRGKNREVQLTDALQLLLQQQPIYAHVFKGTRYDTGSPLGWLKANNAFALRRPDIGPQLKGYLRKLI